MLKSQVDSILRRGSVAASVLLVSLIIAGQAASGAVTNPPTVYNSIPNGLLNNPPTMPANVVSQGFECCGVQEFGDGINLAPGPRYLTTVAVVMSSWACVSGSWTNAFGTANACVTPAGSYTIEPGITVPTFSQPITLNVYASNGAVPPEPGALLGTVTQTFQIPYRPSASGACMSGQWFSVVNAICKNGLANRITFDLSSLGVLLPNQIMVGVAFNTSTAGYKPLGTGNPCNATNAGCPYDSLNVSADTTPATAAAGGGITAIGSVIDPNGVYVSYIPPTAGRACSAASPAAVGNAFLLDTPCWNVPAFGGPLHPEIMVNAAFAPLGGYQVRYASNLGVGDSVVNIINTGATATGVIAANGIGADNGNLCYNVYTFSPDEQLISCCSCFATPNSLASLSARNDLISNTLTPGVPTSIVIKLVATQATTAASCNAATVGTGTNLPSSGMVAKGTSIHLFPVTAGLPAAATYGVAETDFTAATLSPAELSRMTTLCGFIQSNGSGFGICRSCRFGGLGAVAQ